MGRVHHDGINLGIGEFLCSSNSLSPTPMAAATRNLPSYLYWPEDYQYFFDVFNCDQSFQTPLFIHHG